MLSRLVVFTATVNSENNETAIQKQEKSILNAGCSVQKCLFAVISGQHIYLKPSFFSVLGLFVGLIYAHGLLFLFLLPEKCWDFFVELPAVLFF